MQLIRPHTSRMRVLIACEYSGRVRDAFNALGHDAWSSDLRPTLRPGNHWEGDVREILSQPWDMLIAFPPCTHLSKAGTAHWKEKEADGRQKSALDFVQLLMDAPIGKIAIENPVGKINSAIRKPDQIIQPYWFGDPWTKATCLWLKNLPGLAPTEFVRSHGGWVDSGSTRSIQTNKKIRDLTFPGIARAMAQQWGGKL
jgi:site-specific DNA-cytosine methylase